MEKRIQKKRQNMLTEQSSLPHQESPGESPGEPEVELHRLSRVRPTAFSCGGIEVEPDQG